MKNLYRLATQSVTLGSDLPLTASSLFVVDSNNSAVLYVASADSSDYGVFRVDRSGSSVAARLVSVPGEIVGLEHLALSDELCLATAAGEVMVVNLVGEDGGREPEEVTFCGGGLEAMGWSPEQEVVVFVDCTLNVVTMNSAYDPINEVSLQEDTFGDREFMSVGWGKKETQFHGSEGKGARTKKKEEPVEVDLGSLDRRVKISWREDGELFVVGFLGPYGRAFKVFSKEGALQFTSEKCCGLEVALGWRPSGMWIATPQVLQDKYVVALFEKNGLKHREIELPFNRAEEAVEGLHWSNDSEVLIVRTFKTSTAKSCLYFYTIGNYHWYVKQYLEFDKRILGVQWDAKYSEGRTLHVLLENGQYEVSRWDFAVDHSTGQARSDESLVAVIDGPQVLLTNFRGVVVPPPMCGFTLKSDRQINGVGFLRNPEGPWDSNCFFVVDSTNKITFYQPEFTEGTVRRLAGVKTLPKDLELGPGTFSHWLWLRNDLLIVADGSNFVKIFKIVETKLEPQLSLEIGSPGDRIGCIESVSGNAALIELLTGQTFKLTLERGIGLEESTKLPEFCEQLRVHPTGKVYSLRNRQNLYANGVKIASDVTSIFLTERYLLFTTIAELKFVDVANGDAIVGDRRVERGSKLVVVVPKAARTVFQLPRGNLEAITPRVLTLCLVAEHLDGLEYHKAFDILRKERINLNLMVDHNPGLFLENLDRFLEEITNVNWLNLFISDLQNQDVCREMYGSNYAGREVPVIDGYSVETKIEQLCDRFLVAMNKAESNEAYILPKITCYVKKGLLEQALQVIWDLKKAQCQEGAAEEALKYLLYLVEVNDLYNVALGMYDFGLVLFVATKSQKDPKEYLPFLNELKRFDEDYRKFRIDCHLKRFEKAIENISRYADDEPKFQEALQLTIKHGLYPKAIVAYRRHETYYQRICASYGDHLRQNAKQTDASLMYEKAGDYAQAIASARNAVDWGRCLRLARLAGYADDELRRLVQALLPAVQEAGEYRAAARLAKEYLKNDRQAVEILLKDHLFEEALLEADGDLVDKVILPNLDEYLQTLIQKLQSEKEEFLKHKDRLLAVRVEKERRKAEPHHDEEDGRDVEDCDLYSDVSTVASSRHTSSSGRSGKSHRSSKNRRKHERKLLSLKQGNPFEDIALVDALHALVLRICGPDRQHHIRSVCKVAIELDRLGEAKTVQRDYGALFGLVRYSLDAIWIPEMVVPGSGQDVEATAQLTGDLTQVQNVQHYAMIKPHQRYKPDIQSISWQFEVLK
ncbi:elongator complex protein 1 [Culex pipiens pallens]|nr:elongator complex protein 1 [Culex pipiens pallens]